MELKTISEFIASVGFPIAAFAAMFWMCNNTLKQVTSAIESLRDEIHKAQNL